MQLIRSALLALLLVSPAMAAEDNEWHHTADRKSVV